MHKVQQISCYSLNNASRLVHIFCIIYISCSFLEFRVFFFTFYVRLIKVARPETNRSQIPCLACKNLANDAESDSDFTKKTGK